MIFSIIFFTKLVFWTKYWNIVGEKSQSDDNKFFSLFSDLF